MKEILSIYPLRTFKIVGKPVEWTKLDKVYGFNMKYIDLLIEMEYDELSKKENLFIQVKPNEPNVCFIFYNFVVGIEPPEYLGVSNSWLGEASIEIPGWGTFKDCVWHYELLKGFNELTPYDKESHPNCFAYRLAFDFAGENFLSKWSAINGLTVDWFRWDTSIYQVYDFSSGNPIEPKPEVGNCFICERDGHRTELLNNLLAQLDSIIFNCKEEISRLKQKIRELEEYLASLKKDRELVVSFLNKM